MKEIVDRMAEITALFLAAKIPVDATTRDALTVIALYVDANIGDTPKEKLSPMPAVSM